MLPPLPPRKWLQSDLQLLVRGDEELVPAVRRAQAQDDLAAAANDLGGDMHEGLPEAFPFPAHDLRRQRELGDPLAEVPGEPGDLEPGAVTVELGDRHAPSGEAGAELLETFSWLRNSRHRERRNRGIVNAETAAS
jgi:hypothetical protein